MEIKNNLRIALAQVDLVWEDPEQNRVILTKDIESLKGVCDLLVLPETFTTGFSMGALSLAETMEGHTINWMKELSVCTQIAICGSLIIKAGELVYNRFVFVKPDGEVSFYDKRHLFSIGGEAHPFVNGDKKLILEYLGWRIALYICYDLRFPVWCRNVNDTDLMIFTANWPTSRNEVWNILLKARAIENQVVVADVNRIGTDGNGIAYSGNCQTINMRGENINPEITMNNGWTVYELSINELRLFREKFPVARDADNFTIN
jgi:predicted amidohydrolase